MLPCLFSPENSELYVNSVFQLVRRTKEKPLKPNGFRGFWRVPSRIRTDDIQNHNLFYYEIQVLSLLHLIKSFDFGLINY